MDDLASDAIRKETIPMLDIGVYRSATNRWIFGICGGIAERLEVDALWVRISAILLALLPAGLGIPPMVLIYVALRFLLPVRAGG